MIPSMARATGISWCSRRSSRSGSSASFRWRGDGMKSLIPREVETLWTLFTAPVVWALHFLVCYVAMEVFCSKGGIYGVSIDPVRIGLGLFPLAALASIARQSVVWEKSVGEHV